MSILPGESEATKNEKIELVHDYLEKLQERKFVERKSIEEGLFETKIEIEQEAKRPAEARRKRRKAEVRKPRMKLPILRLEAPIPASSGRGI